MTKLLNYFTLVAVIVALSEGYATIGSFVCTRTCPDGTRTVNTDNQCLGFAKANDCRNSLPFCPNGAASLAQDYYRWAQKTDDDEDIAACNAFYDFIQSTQNLSADNETDVAEAQCGCVDFAKTMLTYGSELVSRGLAQQEDFCAGVIEAIGDQLIEPAVCKRPQRGFLARTFCNNIIEGLTQPLAGKFVHPICFFAVELIERTTTFDLNEFYEQADDVLNEAISRAANGICGQSICEDDDPPVCSLVDDVIEAVVPDSCPSSSLTPTTLALAALAIASVVAGILAF